MKKIILISALVFSACNQSGSWRSKTEFVEPKAEVPFKNFNRVYDYKTSLKHYETGYTLDDSKFDYWFNLRNQNYNDKYEKIGGELGSFQYSPHEFQDGEQSFLSHTVINAESITEWILETNADTESKVFNVKNYVYTKKYWDNKCTYTELRSNVNGKKNGVIEEICSKNKEKTPTVKYKDVKGFTNKDAKETFEDYIFNNFVKPDYFKSIRKLKKESYYIIKIPTITDIDWVKNRAIIQIWLEDKDMQLKQDLEYEFNYRWEAKIKKS